MSAKRAHKKSIRVKIISMGNAEVGKSCIIKRVPIRDKEVKINIFDMAGHPIFYEVRNEFYRDTQGAILVYDVNSRESFEALDLWLSEMKQDIGDITELDKVVFCVCANKIDRRTNRVIDETEGRLWADSKGFHYFETSAQSGEGVSEMFQTLFNGVVKAFENGGKVERIATTLGYTKDQVEAIQRLKNSKDNYERLGLMPGASKDDINKAYRKLAVLLHPDKNVAPGSEEAFKILVSARTELLKQR
ncbi:dnaJ homolog subfamily C member 27-like [Saccoglossus kowalevskii]|uniref:DnaJ homolog subfamily C member 27-like n=1 Tax=Saccoglossus kowalevskii TaxID=10224 RepID=A0ABM0GXT9_SACKO|nr:PREDICTED: dnaJ homolog subfamily C member 27-like [Saccoglossus kowalevskii]